ncbi:hypothetical protein I6J18_19995 [Peribacillus psychrosaccharolyticus]|uniref:DUF2642 domain-containing protein n=1 Tax=Peribacillus psychrosaccharolyticus TaxID=1407 RepID=A0A974NL86_PERPY|nr:hypothetical protein [Peribacillus psychrosaccharolyticus]MEC2054409.1 hypothetical protein [Peribacillus psychrosaccharolyticus]MED3744363.1 hypothetical protein [Peribacillus psychrosaccharolyticus]QQS99839.1 hypothetical protein I6J18_19995 [Peribacillus psychrosaccharolyticus]
MLSTYLEQFISIQLSEEIEITGVLKDASPDMIILSECERYRYIPIRHIQQITFPDCQMKTVKLGYGKTSFRKSLMSAKGRCVYVLLGKNTVLNGYIMSIMTNYIVFYSPIYKTIFISMDHVKSMTFAEMDAPYGQVTRDFQPSTHALSRMFEEQLQKLIGKLVVFDLGDIPQKTGTLLGVEDGLVCFMTAKGDETFLSIKHIRLFFTR